MSTIERQPSKREIVETELRRIWDERAELSAADILEEARSEDSRPWRLSSASSDVSSRRSDTT